MDDILNVDNVITHLRQSGANKYVCPICGGHKFSISGDVATINTTKRITTLNLGTYVPCAMMICSTCGNIQFFALPIINAVTPNDGGKKNDGS